MKNFIKIPVFLWLLSLCSCTKVLYTHEQVLDSYKTKQDVQRKFGAPAERKINQNGEEWLYTYDAEQQTQGLTTNTVTELGRYKNYVLFSFDNQGNITSRHAEGVDLSEKKVSALKTIALVAGLAVVLFGTLALSSNTFTVFY